MKHSDNRFEVQVGSTIGVKALASDMKEASESLAHVSVHGIVGWYHPKAHYSSVKADETMSKADVAATLRATIHQLIIDAMAADLDEFDNDAYGEGEGGHVIKWWIEYTISSNVYTIRVCAFHPAQLYNVGVGVVGHVWIVSP